MYPYIADDSMYFLNGDRIYIKPKQRCHSLNEQLDNCLEQLSQINSGQKVFKLNFFAEIETKKEYEELQNKITVKVNNLFSGEVLVAVLAQPPLTCKIIVEVCFYDPRDWQVTFLTGQNGGAAYFKKAKTGILIGSTQSNSNSSCKTDAEKAFDELSKIFNAAGFPVNSIMRQWNYIENILGHDGEKQRYQEFNNVRTSVYGNSFSKTGYPAATGIGMNQGGIIIEFLAIKSDELITVPINNPNQIPAHTYSKDVLVGEECLLKSTPKFERAKYIEIFGRKLVFISGTASIVGEHTVGVDDPGEQTRITINNIQQLYSEDTLQKLSLTSLNPKYGHARIYLKNRKDFAVIKRTFKSFYGNLPVVYIIADICRKDLLVEIEGKVILE